MEHFHFEKNSSKREI